MRLGLFPGQQEFIRKAVRDAENYRGARRRFLAIFGLGVAGAAGAGFAGGRMMREADLPQTSEAQLLAEMKRIAVGPMPELLHRHATFLSFLDDHPDEALLWVGFERLGLTSIVEERRELRARLLTTARAKVVPDHITPLVARLQGR